MSLEEGKNRKNAQNRVGKNEYQGGMQRPVMKCSDELKKSVLSHFKAF